MSIKCYSKPKRQFPRTFTPCDAARIAKYAANGRTRDEIIATVGFDLGYFRIINASTFNEDTLKEIIMGVLQAVDLASAVPLLARNPIWFAFFKFIKISSEAFAIILVPVVLAIMAAYEIKGAKPCSRK